ncbi:unnamed protein product [Protopolystoma xenopodis]|uniref:Uncharacterized protein n=1 Tax=Protopolystoma xenopodis TaxID=117903 RepID=A0A448WI59_9PLAT|nr:unnamed protein product [Protopolystoma xenopodis]
MFCDALDCVDPFLGLRDLCLRASQISSCPSDTLDFNPSHRANEQTISAYLSLNDCLLHELYHPNIFSRLILTFADIHPAPSSSPLINSVLPVSAASNLAGSSFSVMPDCAGSSDLAAEDKAENLKRCRQILHCLFQRKIYPAIGVIYCSDKAYSLPNFDDVTFPHSFEKPMKSTGKPRLTYPVQVSLIILKFS